MRIGILTFEQFHGRRDIGSSRIRGKWLAKYWPEAELFKSGRKYDIVIYQKVYWPEHAKIFKGIKILDMCDPDFLNWQYPIKETIEEVNAITTSTDILAKAMRKMTDKPVEYIPDRVDLEAHRERKYHQGEAKWTVWFGYSSGFEMLKPVLHFLRKEKLNLIAISDTNFSLPSVYTEEIEVKNCLWSLDTVNNDIISGDMVLNLQSEKGKWKFKSNNKTLTAWALGMPVASTIEDLIRFKSEEERRREAKLRLKEIKEKWDIKLSVLEFKDLIQKIENTKKG